MDGCPSSANVDPVGRDRKDGGCDVASAHLTAHPNHASPPPLPSPHLRRRRRRADHLSTDEPLPGLHPGALPRRVLITASA
ncbi:hypothetical protein ACP4OV_018324 [Aristida adscensionis]